MDKIDEAEEQFSEIEGWSIPDEYASELMWCRCKLLRLRNNKREAVELLKEGLNLYTEQSERYVLLHELYLNTLDRNILSECIDQGEQYYTQNPTWHLRKTLDELKET